MAKGDSVVQLVCFLEFRSFQFFLLNQLRRRPVASQLAQLDNMILPPFRLSSLLRRAMPTKWDGWRPARMRQVMWKAHLHVVGFLKNKGFQ